MVHSDCFECNFEVGLNICSRSNKQTQFSELKIYIGSSSNHTMIRLYIYWRGQAYFFYYIQSNEIQENID